jgi:cytochrome c-type biogenesis protein CcmH/NrfG
VKQAPDDAEAHRLLGVILLRMGRMDEAVKELETCVELAPDNADYARLLESAKRTRTLHRQMGGGRHKVPSHGAPH